MNLIEADSRDFLLNRFHRRVESYRMHHEQNYRLYQPIRREEVRKQLEETNQLHKRWIEFQAKRSVGKAKNDSFVSNAPPFTKKLKKKPTSPEIPSSQSFNPSTVFKKSLANVSSICQDFNNHQNVYQNYDKSSANSKKIVSNLEPLDLFHSPSNDEFSINGNKLPIDKTSSLTIHLQDKDPDENYEKMDDEKEIDSIFLGEEWDKFWDSISRDGEMPKEVLKVLQENETSDDLAQASLNNQNLFQDNVGASSNNAASVALSTSVVSCGNKSNFIHSALQLTHANSFTEQRVIRNDPNYVNHIPFKHNNTPSRISRGVVGHALEGLPSYDDVVNGRFAHSLVQHRNTPNAETNRHSLIHQQQFCHQRVQKNVICRKENDFTNHNLVPYHQNSFGIISESTFYHPAASQNMYLNDFHNFGEGRFSDFQNQSYSKMNFENYDFLSTQQQPFPSQQSYLMDERANDSEMSHDMDRNHFHWSYNDSINAYQKEDNMIINNISTYTHRNTFFQPSNNDFKHFDPTSYSTTTINDDRKICMGIIQQHHNLPDISVETELSLIQDIINRK